MKKIVFYLMLLALAHIGMPGAVVPGYEGSLAYSASPDPPPSPPDRPNPPPPPPPPDTIS